MITKEFKVITVSENTNSFGLKQLYMVSKEGVVYRACMTSQFCPKKGDIVNVPITIKDNKIVDFNLSSLGYELPELLPSAPEHVITEIWKDQTN